MAEQRAAVLQSDEVSQRLQRLEEAVFKGPNQSVISPQSEASVSDSAQKGYTPFGFHVSIPLPDDHDDKARITSLASKLPPLAQSRLLLSHYASTVHLNCGILHIPTCTSVLEDTYAVKDNFPRLESLLLLFSIFAGAAFAWSPKLLQQLRSTQAEAKAASNAYLRLSMSIVDDSSRSLTPSTTALAAMANLNNLTTHSRGLSDNAVVLRMKCHIMAHSLRLDRLDTAKSREDRGRKGCNMIHIEIQRRVWWNLVGTDWLNGFSGERHDGMYFLQPKHMNVRFPINMEDDDMTPDMADTDVPLSVPTMMTGFIYRIKIAELCREVVDALPSQFQDTEEPDYNIIMQMDRKFRSFAEDLPVFFRLDTESIEKSKHICKEKPVIAQHRVALHFSIHGRLCRLHRPYHLEGLTNPKYAYSRKSCVSDAQRVLDLRRKLDEACVSTGMQPARSWVTMQHVSIAALILATDVSFNPSAPNAADMKAKVLATYGLLERSIEESGTVMDGVQRNMQALTSTLQSKRGQDDNQSQHPTGDGPSAFPSTSDATMIDVDEHESGVAGLRSGGHLPSFVDDLQDDQTNWDELWKDFVDIAPEMDMSHWDLLLEDIDTRI